MLYAGVLGATHSVPFVSPQMLEGLLTGQDQPAVDLLANDMWAMGVALVQMLTAYNMFGVNFEDGTDALKQRHNTAFQKQMAASRQLDWVRF